jgi:hypothetical protein
MTAPALQLSLWAEIPPPAADCSRSTNYWRKRLSVAVRKAYELGLRRGAPIQSTIAARPLPPAVPQLLLVRTTYLARPVDRNELALLATRVARLSIDRRDPENFFCERSEIAHALREIARRA